jgi:hypothetical protein
VVEDGLMGRLARRRLGSVVLQTRLARKAEAEVRAAKGDPKRCRDILSERGGIASRFRRPRAESPGPSPGRA